MKTLGRIAVSFALLTPIALNAQWVPLNPISSAEKTSDGVVFTMQTGRMKIRCS
jgi:hypothetical protein